MKSYKKIKAAFATAFLLSAASVSMAGSFDGVNSNGQGLGKVSRNVASSLVDAGSAFEAFLYIAGIFFVVMFVLSLVKWKKTDGQQGSPGLIAVYLLAAVLCVGAPTVLGGGLSTIFGSGTVQTVKAPSISGVNP